MNRRGFTLVEVIVAGTIFLLALACFNYLSKISMGYLARARARTLALARARTTMETASGEAIISKIDDDLVMIQVGKFYTLRSKYR